jgi:predicted RNA-binding Zn-ribbon protein involved in translation (DUF1610 family)
VLCSKPALTSSGSEMKVSKSPTIFPMPTCPPQEIVALEKCREIAADLGTDVLTEKDEKDQ